MNGQSQLPLGCPVALLTLWVPGPNTPYDGCFPFVRAKDETAAGGYWWRGQPSRALVRIRFG